VRAAIFWPVPAKCRPKDKTHANPQTGSCTQTLRHNMDSKSKLSPLVTILTCRRSIPPLGLPDQPVRQGDTKLAVYPIGAQASCSADWLESCPAWAKHRHVGHARSPPAAFVGRGLPLLLYLLSNVRAAGRVPNSYTKRKLSLVARSSTVVFSTVISTLRKLTITSSNCWTNSSWLNLDAPRPI
jgi:hypothetical protein